MSRRKRKAIPREQLLAAALSLLLSQEERDYLRRERASAREVIRRFTPDHIELHCFGGQDKWWNLDMRLRGKELKQKDARDTSIAAKAVRIDKKWGSFVSRALAVNKKLNRQSNAMEADARRWPKGRKLQSKPFKQDGRVR